MISATEVTNSERRVPQLYAVSIGLAVLTFIYTYWSTMVALNATWMGDSGYSHGYLVLAVALYLAWLAREPIESPKVDWTAIAVLLAATIAYSVAVISHFHLAKLAMLPIIVFPLIASLGGRRNAMRFLPALAYFYFAIPIWIVLTPFLQKLTVAVVGFCMVQSGIPVFIDANYVQIPSGTFEIASGCAGTRFFVVALAIGMLIAYLSDVCARQRILIVGAAATLAIIGNWVRVFTIIQIGHRSEMKHSLITEGHMLFGWIIFMVLMSLLFALTYKLPVRDIGSSHPALARGDQKSFAPMAIVSALMALILPVMYAEGTVVAARESQFEFSIDWPASVGEWDKQIDTDWSPVFPGADYLTTAAYGRGGEVAVAYFAGYRFQTQGKEVEAYANTPFPSSLTVANVENVEVGAAIYRVDTLVDYQSRQSIAIYRYKVGDKYLTGRLAAKLQLVLQTLAGNYPAAVEGVWVECPDTCLLSTRDYAALIHQALGESR